MLRTAAQEPHGHESAHFLRKKTQSLREPPPDAHPREAVQHFKSLLLSDLQALPSLSKWLEETGAAIEGESRNCPVLQQSLMRTDYRELW